MNSTLSRTLAALVCLAALSGCEKKSTAPVAEAESSTPHEENVVVLSKENLALVSLKTELASRGSLGVTLKAVGRVAENLNKTAKVTTTLEGRLTKLNADLDDRVKAGDVLALVQTPELLGRLLELKAPINGVIVERMGTVGELIGKETAVYTIGDPSDLWVQAEIKERDIGAVRTGQEVSFSVLAYHGDTFHGKIALVGNRVETESRTMEVRVEVANPDGRLKPGMFADVEIATTALQDVLVISDQAIQSMDNEPVVFVATSDQRFEKRVIKVGLEQHGRVQVLDGLKEGDRVVTEGSFILKSEMLKGELGEE
jgi:multidrug efflux pump subunit AcrA (membrane-fusion protein)